MADPSEPGAGDVLVAMAEKESEALRRRRALREDFAQRGERLLRDVPARYLALAQGLRQAADRFNQGLTEEEPGLRVHHSESPLLTLRDVAAGGDLLATVSRHHDRFDLLLRFLSRTGRPDLPIIEGHGSYFKGGKVMLRIEGWVEQGQTIFWVSLDFKRMQVDLSELPDRIVMSVVQHDPEMLYRPLRPGPAAQQAT